MTEVAFRWSFSIFIHFNYLFDVVLALGTNQVFEAQKAQKT